jgi:hypothetical protein
MLTRFLALKHSDRLRALGWLVLAVGAIAAAVFYGIEARNADPVLNDVTALGYARSMHHQMGVMMGQFGIMLTEWHDALTTPAGEAIMIAAGAAAIAGCLFRAAWVLDQNDQH